MANESQKSKPLEKQRFAQTVKCPVCGAEVSFDWEEVGHVAVKVEEPESQFARSCELQAAGLVEIEGEVGK